MQAEKRTFTWPSHIQTPSLESFLDPTEAGAEPQFPTSKTQLRNLHDVTARLKEEGRLRGAKGIADLGYGFAGANCFRWDGCPCLTRAHCSGNTFYALSRQRFLRLSEYMRLQGIDAKRLVIPDNVPQSHARQMCGNSFSVPVVAQILDRLLYASGLTDSPFQFTDDGLADGEVWH